MEVLKAEIIDVSETIAYWSGHRGLCLTVDYERWMNRWNA